MSGAIREQPPLLIVPWFFVTIFLLSLSVVKYTVAHILTRAQQIMYRS